MFLAYVVVTALAAAVNIYAATNDFRRVEWLSASMNRLRIPQSWLLRLGILKISGALGLLVGFAVPWIGVAAATGLVLFFVAAIVFTVRARWYLHLPYPTTWLLLVSGSLALRIATAYVR